MAEGASSNQFVMVNSVDLSGKCESAELSNPYETPNYLQMVASGVPTQKRVYVSQDLKLTLTFTEDQASGQTDATIRGCRGVVVPIRYRYDQGAISTTNPEWQFNAVLEGYTIGGAAGSRGTKQVVFSVADGTYTIDTTP